MSYKQLNRKSWVILITKTFFARLVTFITDSDMCEDPCVAIYHA